MLMCRQPLLDLRQASGTCYVWPSRCQKRVAVGAHRQDSGTHIKLDDQCGIQSLQSIFDDTITRSIEALPCIVLRTPRHSTERHPGRAPCMIAGGLRLTS